MNKLSYLSTRIHGCPYSRPAPLTAPAFEMANFFSGIGNVTMPNTITGVGPLPPSTIPSSNVEFQTPDGIINEANALLDNVDAYSYGPNPKRPSTQTSYINHPHRIQKVIPKIFIPAACGDRNTPDVPLAHSLHDGDLTFTLRMPKEMVVGPSEFCQARNIPGRTLAQLVNLATVNYLLWGLQVGRSATENPRNNRWNDFFLRLTQGRLHHHKTLDSEQGVWNFLQTYLRPFGVMVGSDMQGGQHEGGENNVATYPVDYVASFLIDGKCRKLNNVWRHNNIAAGDDLVLVLRKTGPEHRNITHILTSGARTFREERTTGIKPWFYLAPEVASYTTTRHPYIHIGRAQAMYSSYNAGMGMGRVPWDARAALIGQGVQVTFAPTFVTPDAVTSGPLPASSDVDTGLAGAPESAPPLDPVLDHELPPDTEQPQQPKKKKKKVAITSSSLPLNLAPEVWAEASSTTADTST